jgi:hypothetical protein
MDGLFEPPSLRSAVLSMTWIDLTGQWWIAPLGSTEPGLDRPVPPEWVPIKHLSREEVEPR